MPQMSKMNWVILLLFFSGSYFIVAIKLFYLK